MFLFGIHVPQTTTSLTIDLTAPSVPVSPMLYGLMTEEINHSYDGGLYAELVQNRAFRDGRDKPLHWAAVGDGSSLELETGSVQPVLRVRGGVANDGFWGIPVMPATAYRLNLWVKAEGAGAIDASIESADGATVFAHTKVAGVDGTWRKLSAILKTSREANPSSEARLVLRTGASRTIWLQLVSLFPPTFKGRPNGNRPDLMRLLVDMRPSFLRFPGGNYLEGSSVKNRFDWKRTLGPVEDRPGHIAPWGYRSTDGMGLLEFLQWTEDMRARPVLALFAGYDLGGHHIDAGLALTPYVQDALDEIEYVSGGPDTKWGAARARNGHPKPFPLQYVEIGNEDGFDRSGSYQSRFVQFYDAIKAKYPKLKVISTTGGKDWLGQRFPITQRTPDLVDEHYYASTWDMMAMASKYDAYDRKGPKIFVGEWAAQDVPEPWTNPGRKGPTPNMNCALADAAFMTGLERNSDVVDMACYAPLLVNVNPGARQWAVNLIGFDALNSFGSPSYWGQRMFMENLGNRTVHVSIEGGPPQTRGNQTIPGIFVSATRDERSGALYLKVVNTLATPQDVAIVVKGASVAPQATMTVLSGDPKAMNSLAAPSSVVPVTSLVKGLAKSFVRKFGPDSITVFKLSTGR